MPVYNGKCPACGNFEYGVCSGKELPKRVCRKCGEAEMVFIDLSEDPAFAAAEDVINKLSGLLISIIESTEDERKLNLILAEKYLSRGEKTKEGWRWPVKEEEKEDGQAEHSTG